MPVTQSSLQPNGCGFLTDPEDLSRVVVCIPLLRQLHLYDILLTASLLANSCLGSLVSHLVGTLLAVLLGNVMFSFTDWALIASG